MINKTAIAALIGRPFSQDEASALEWVDGWENSTQRAIEMLVKSAYENGMKQRNAVPTEFKMTDQQITEFGQSLAERYAQVLEEATIAGRIYHRRRFMMGVFRWKP
ncbi:hypothetical protein [Paenibacillus donghaensis]|uniref:Uncharacterized protein n=1 Tax=Paenibacillus donghaensis TaxID=414771 RepID=A0A2Z2K6V0_9BACL|nr:hypothetical protein [Paenibacillus donghaensis]ASA21996.1 hypothetical protein B9T62_15165 [Paenibacillus donghaensis]